MAGFLAIIASLACALIMPVIDRDEARFVQASAQMMESGDYINIRNQEEARNKKPVGIHWFQAASVQLTSKTEARDILSYRWPSILGAGLAAFACAWGARRFFGHKTATRAGLLFGVSFLLTSEGFIAKTDGLLAGLITLMMTALGLIYLAAQKEGQGPNTIRGGGLIREKLIFWISLSLAVLVKGPIAPMVGGLSLLALFLFDRKLPMLKHMGWGWGILILLVICGPWAVMITIATDGAFWTGAVGQDLGRKLATGDEGHGGPIGYHLALLPVMLFPVSFLLGGAFQTAITRFREAGVRFALAWVIPSWILFELLPTKLPHYILPLLGGVVWLGAASLEIPLKSWAKALNLIIGTFGSIVILGLAYAGYEQFGSALQWPLVIVIGIAVLFMAILGTWLLSFKGERTGLMLLIGAGLIGHFAFFSLAARLKPLWLSQAMERAMVEAAKDPRRGQAPGPVAVIGYAEPSFVFRMGTKTELLNDNVAGAVKALKENRPLWVDNRYHDQVIASARLEGINIQKAAQISGTNYNGGRAVTMRLYIAPIESATGS
jgi:4-amino-4-deoxy-L-arabinose transferase-like glycosyltransferase